LAGYLHGHKLAGGLAALRPGTDTATLSLELATFFYSPLALSPTGLLTASSPPVAKDNVGQKKFVPKQELTK
jgi:hypothetical protein